MDISEASLVQRRQCNNLPNILTLSRENVHCQQNAKIIDKLFIYSSDGARQVLEVISGIEEDPKPLRREDDFSFFIHLDVAFSSTNNKTKIQLNTAPGRLRQAMQVLLLLVVPLKKLLMLPKIIKGIRNNFEWKNK